MELVLEGSPLCLVPQSTAVLPGSQAWDLPAVRQRHGGGVLPVSLTRQAQMGIEAAVVPEGGKTRETACPLLDRNTLPSVLVPGTGV